MITNRNLAILSTVILSGLIVPRTQAASEVSVDFFYDQLDPYGDWVEVGDYGYCWHPRDVDRTWRPYSDGRWVNTDAGWTWVSEEPYGWAVYHYGRWARVENTGWVWVPGTEWGPAWVSWRNNDRYLGWAPLPPEARFTASVGFGGGVDVSFDIGPTYYSFVETRNFGAPRLRDVIVEPQQNITIINQTTNITNIRTVNNVVINEGPRYEVVAKASAQPIPRLKLDRATAVQGDSHAFASKIEGGSLHVAAPAIAAAKPEAKPKKVAAKIDKSQINHGWKDAGSPEDVEKARAKMKTESATAATEPGNEPKPAAEGVRPKPAEARPPANEKPAVGTEPPTAEKPPVPSNPPGAGKGPHGKPERIAPGEPNPSVPNAAEKPDEPRGPQPSPEKKGKQPGANEVPLPAAGPGAEPHGPQPGKEKKEKHPGTNEVPPPPPAAPGGEPREPKLQRERPEPPPREAEQEKPRVNKGEPRPEEPHGAPQPHAAPQQHPKPAAPEAGKPGQEKKGKDKDKDKDQ